MKTITPNPIELYRAEHGLTFQQLADMAGISSRAAVFGHCKGKQVSGESAIKYWDRLGLPIRELRPDLFTTPPHPTDAPHATEA